MQSDYKFRQNNRTVVRHILFLQVIISILNGFDLTVRKIPDFINIEIFLGQPQPFKAHWVLSVPLALTYKSLHSVNREY
jgi:hypothetical protein